ncbi:MAG: peptide ABC transporter substrate-binding protein [Clostridia bacterium]|nr:peptide ABC transporter substrate-binding protein [Clostridia bacterium]
MKRTVSLLLAAALLVSSVGVLSSCKKIPDTITVNLGAATQTIDPTMNTTADGATYILHLFAGLLGYEPDEKGQAQLVARCAEAIPQPVKEANGKVSYTFKLRRGLKWSDGSALTAQDFVYAWNRAADPANSSGNADLFSCIDGYNDVVNMYKTTSDSQGKLQLQLDAQGLPIYKKDKKSLNVIASEDGSELKVTLPVDQPYFLELCALPAFMPIKEALVNEHGGAWAESAETYIGNGPYKVEEYTQERLVMKKNRHYFEADRVVTENLIFVFDGDNKAALTGFKNGDYAFIDAVPNDEIDALKQDMKDEFFVRVQLGTYFLCMNVNDPALQDFTEEERVKIRQAMSLVLDRNYIVTNISKGNEIPATGFVPMGLKEPDGSEFISKNGPDRNGKGYFSAEAIDYRDNCDKAVELLSQVAESSGKFTVENGKLVNFPRLTYLTNDDSTHTAVANYLQQTWSNYGIYVKIESKEWSELPSVRQQGAFSIARHGWLGDYNDPISFLDLWTVGSAHNDCQFGRGAHGTYVGFGEAEAPLNWSGAYDVLIAEIKAESDAVKRFEKMHAAEDLLMSTGAVCPLYYNTDVYMCSENMKGFFTTPLGYKFFTYASLESAKE